jgi:hypothetical protein
MEESIKRDNREDVFSEIVRAGQRTYFLDVKETRGGEKFITITESKRRFNDASGKFFYEKHKIFLYKEDFEKFINGLDSVIKYVETGVPSEKSEAKEYPKAEENLTFEDLKEDTTGEEES